jgi:L-asparaginase
MTSEAALTKLAVLLGHEYDAPTVARMMQRDTAGELSRQDLPSVIHAG